LLNGAAADSTHAGYGPEFAEESGDGTVGSNLKLGLLVLAMLTGVIYAKSEVMNMSMIDTVRQLGTDLLHRLFY